MKLAREYEPAKKSASGREDFAPLHIPEQTANVNLSFESCLI